MAADREQAANDLNAKLRLEAQFRANLRDSNRTLFSEFIQALGATGQIPLENPDRLSGSLLAHYLAVGLVFNRRLRDQLVFPNGITSQEEVAIDQALGGFFSRRSREQSAFIAQTDRLNMIDSVGVAEQERQRLAEMGTDDALQSRRGFALVAGAVFARKLRGRESGIVCLETQVPAEAAKLTEAQVLLGEPPSVTGGPGGGGVGSKEWVTQGDELVRTSPFDHLSADGQKVSTNEAFEVSGERLNHPSDTTLGASVGNVINCRCAAVHDVAAIARSRR